MLYVLRLSFVLHGKRILQTQSRPIDVPLCSNVLFCGKPWGATFATIQRGAYEGQGLGAAGWLAALLISGSRWFRIYVIERTTEVSVDRSMNRTPFTDTERPLRIYL